MRQTWPTEAILSIWQTQSASFRPWWDSHAFSRRIPLNRRPPQVDLKKECRRENSCVNLPIGPWLPANAATRSITVPGSAWIPARLGRRCGGRWKRASFVYSNGLHSWTETRERAAACAASCASGMFVRSVRGALYIRPGDRPQIDPNLELPGEIAISRGPPD